MKLNFLIFAMVLAGMGPARDAPPPPVSEAAPATETSRPMSPEEMPAAEDPPAEAPDLVIYGAGEVAPEDFMWISRPIVVFSDTPEDPAFRQQMQMLRDQPASLAERDVVVITDADPSADSIWRQQLHPRGFSLVLIDKDGQVKLRKPFPWDVREISRAIDKFPLRRQEVGRAAVMP